MSARQNQQANEVIYKAFSDSMKHNSRDQVVAVGNVVKSLMQDAHESSRLTHLMPDFIKLEQTLESIEYNLNKVCVLTKQPKR